LSGLDWPIGISGEEKAGEAAIKKSAENFGGKRYKRAVTRRRGLEK